MSGFLAFCAFLTLLRLRLAADSMTHRDVRILWRPLKTKVSLYFLLDSSPKGQYFKIIYVRGENASIKGVKYFVFWEALQVV